MEEQTYKKSYLEELTTVQLKQICMREKLINGIKNTLSHYELIDTIMRFRGEAENLYIHEICEDGETRVQEALQINLGTNLKECELIHCPSKLVLYKDLALTPYENYQISAGCSDDMVYQMNQQTILKQIRNTNVLLVDEKMRLCGIFQAVEMNEKNYLYLIKDERQNLMITDSKEFFFLFFQKRESDALYHYYYNQEESPLILNYYKVPISKIEERKVEETDAILSIDFGTSNTTAGTYLDQNYIKTLDENDIANKQTRLGSINMVSFFACQENYQEFVPIIPTLASVSSCQGDKVCYHFGYEARNDAKVKYYDETFSVFYEMKRWVETYEEEIEVMDREGNISHVTKASIIQQYLNYVIGQAENRFKCRFKRLHLTYPVKLKEKFIKMFQELLPDYEVMEEGMLDEGSAVLYNTIHTMIKNKKYYDGEKLAALIIDCGGGTTDLSSCIFRIHNLGSSYQVAIDTAYENGETNFGGNNITYRIMQYLKIVYAHYYQEERTIRNSLSYQDCVAEYIDERQQDIYRMVDRLGREGVYQRLEEEYNRAEAIIPTKFKEYENKNREEYYKIKNNFYFLFQIAEQLKKEFFKETGVLSCCFKPLERKENQEYVKQGNERTIYVSNWNIEVVKTDRYELHHDIPDIVFSIHDMELLLKGDIYWIINKFFNAMFQAGELEQYSIIKLSGQSCRIPFFRDAIKEFIPGKCIEFKPFNKEENTIMDLKLACVRGAIWYKHAVDHGMIKAEITSSSRNIPYKICALTHEGEEKVIINSLNKEQCFGTITRNKELTKLEFFLKDTEGNLKYHYYYENDKNQYEPCTYEDIKEKYITYQEYIMQEETDIIRDYEVKFFVFTAKNQWGFYVVPIQRTGPQLYLGKEKFFAFENNLWEVNFFDGDK